MEPLRVLDLFSGIGGFSLGLERTGGFETVAFCEIEPFCQKVLRKHWPDVPIFDDVCKLTGDDVGTVDVICGGFPCQDISFAGKGAGIEGERSGLWSEYARLVGEIRPQFVIVENVAALLNRGLGRVLGDLAALGYDAEWHCVPASAIGAPHRRDRIWVVSYPACERRAKAEQLRLPEFAEWFSRRHQTVDYSNNREIRVQGVRPRSVQEFSEFSWCQNVRGIEDIRGRSDLPEPVFWGVGDGVSDWVDRIGSLGNAVVPQIPELIGYAILDAMQAEAA